MILTLTQRQRLNSLRRINLYFSTVLLTINLFVAGFNLYTLVTGVLLSLAIGFSVAVIEVFLFPNSLQQLNFLTTVLVKTFLYLCILLLLILPLSQLLSRLYWLIDISGRDLAHRNMHPMLQNVNQILERPWAFLRTVFIYLVGCFFIVFVSQISRIMGPGVLRSFLTGKYYKPVVENRVFMFLDLKSSTTIAEKLDNMAYSHLIRDVYFHMGEPILQTRGEIYQYVGDEVIISWLVKGSDKQPPLCIECFWKIEQALEAQRDYYERTYGLMPQFKAGLHYGLVVATFVGDVKRELVYHGDVMNTAARIQELCNVLNQRLLLSEQLAGLLVPPEGRRFVSLGRVQLKGKQQEVGIYRVE